MPATLQGAGGTVGFILEDFMPRSMQGPWPWSALYSPFLPVAGLGPWEIYRLDIDRHPGQNTYQSCTECRRSFTQDGWQEDQLALPEMRNSTPRLIHIRHILQQRIEVEQQSTWMLHSQACKRFTAALSVLSAEAPS